MGPLHLDRSLQDEAMYCVLMPKGADRIARCSERGNMVLPDHVDGSCPHHVDLLAPLPGGDGAFKCLGLSLDFSSSKYHQLL